MPPPPSRAPAAASAPQQVPVPKKAAPKTASQPKKSPAPPKAGKAGGMSMGLLGDIAARRID